MTPYATPKHTLTRRARAAAVAALVLTVSAPHAQAQAAPPVVTEAQIEAVSGEYGVVTPYEKEVQAGTLSLENYEKLVAIRDQAADHIDEMITRDIGRIGFTKENMIALLDGHIDALKAAVANKNGAGVADATLQTGADTINKVALPVQAEVTIVVSYYVDLVRTLTMARAAMPNNNPALTQHTLETLDEADRVVANKMYVERQQMEKDADALAHMPAAEKAKMAAKIQEALDNGDIQVDGDGNLTISAKLQAKMDAAKIASNGSSRGSNGSVVNGNGTVKVGVTGTGGTGTNTGGGNGASPARSPGAGTSTGTANAGTPTGNGDPAFSAGNGANNGAGPSAPNGQASGSGSGDGVNSTATAGGQGSGYSSGGGTGSERPILYVTTSTNGIPDSIPAMVNGRWTLVNNPASPRNAQNSDSPPGYLVDGDQAGGDQAGGEDGLNALLAEANAVSSGLNSALADQGLSADSGPVSVTLAPIYTGYRVVPGDNGSSVIAVTSTQVQVPTAVMTVPSTQINVPSPVMTSLDLYPALCGS